MPICEPHAGQPPQATGLLGRHRFLDSAELGGGSRLHLDENQGTVVPFGGDDVEFTPAAAPVPGQDGHPQRDQVVDRELFAERSDLGTSHAWWCVHAATVAGATDRSRADGPRIRRATGSYSQCGIHPQGSPTD